jgi:hypothetical protein
MSTQVYTDNQTPTNTERGSKAMVVTGIILSTLIILFMLMDAGMKLIQPTPSFVADAEIKLGYPVSATLGIGVVLLLSTILYAIPRTSVLGAILLTGYLGGACSTHVRVQDGAFNTLFPVIFGVILWAGLYLRDSRVRNLLPIVGK